MLRIQPWGSFTTTSYQNEDRTQNEKLTLFNMQMNGEWSVYYENEWAIRIDIRFHGTIQ